jgi:hypothetical protein
MNTYQLTLGDTVVGTITAVDDATACQDAQAEADECCDPGTPWMLVGEDTDVVFNGKAKFVKDLD